MRLRRSILGVCFFILLLTLQAFSETITWKDGLSDRELSIQRWFSWLTFMQDRNGPWNGWYDDGSQLGVTAYRYQFAFCGYACAAMAAKTPAYRDLAERQLVDLCERMIDRRTWFWVTKYWQYEGGLPDPCRYENVMYTGHLTQLIGLLELITGNLHYSDQGWKFVWQEGQVVPYTLDKAIRGLWEQSCRSPSGGICCEPGLVFADCNNHSAASFLIYDTVHQTRYSEVNQRWYDWMRRRFRNKVPFTREFMYVIYDQKHGVFYPVGDVGADGWALGFGYPWYPDTTFFDAGWKHIVKKAKWITPAPDQCYAKSNTVVGCCAGGSLSMSNSFLPLVAVQAEGKDSEQARKILRWLEASFGKAQDTDADGYEESYYYNVCPKHYAAATGVIATALATDGDSMRRLYRTPWTDRWKEPTLSQVDYPNVYVRAAEYRDKILRLVICKGKPSFYGNTDLICKEIPPAASVFRDGVSWSGFTQSDNTLTIHTDVDSEHIFEVRCR